MSDWVSTAHRWWDALCLLYEHFPTFTIIFGIGIFGLIAKEILAARDSANLAKIAKAVEAPKKGDGR